MNVIERRVPWWHRNRHRRQTGRVRPTRQSEVSVRVVFRHRHRGPRVCRNSDRSTERRQSHTRIRMQARTFNYRRRSDSTRWRLTTGGRTVTGRGASRPLKTPTPHIRPTLSDASQQSCREDDTEKNVCIEPAPRLKPGLRPPERRRKKKSLLHGIS